MKQSNYLKYGLLVLVIFLAGAQMAAACEVEFQVIKGQQETYEAGDVIIVKATIAVAHRNCQQWQDMTKFDCTGAEIKGASSWKKVSSSEYNRKLKLRVLADHEKKIELTGTHSCRRGPSEKKLVLAKKATSK